MIPEELYKQIMENMPILCVDLVLENEGKVLLAYRNNEPLKNQWCVPGGRILKNETFAEAVNRKAKQELGIEVETIKRIGCYEIFFDKSPFDTDVHNVSVVFLVKPKTEDFQIHLDNQNKEFKWVSEIDDDLHDYVKQVLNDSGVLK